MIQGNPRGNKKKRVVFSVRVGYDVLQAEVRTLTSETNRRMNEEKALLEEEKLTENLTKVELRESRALCSSLRMKLNYYGEEVARLR